MRKKAIRAVMRAAAAAYPQECCGLLLGHAPQDGRSTVETVVPLRNVAATPTRGYELDPDELLAAETTTRAAGLVVLGVYHSHPNGDARPSARDLRAAEPGWLYVVASATGEAEPEVRCYRLRADGGGFDELALG